MWEGKVFAAADADADAADAAETDWKRKVIPERGDLMILLVIAGDITVMQAYIIKYQHTSSLSMQVNSSTTVVSTRMDQVKAAMIEENMVYL